MSGEARAEASVCSVSQTALDEKMTLDLNSLLEVGSGL